MSASKNDDEVEGASGDGDVNADEDDDADDDEVDSVELALHDMMASKLR